MSLSRIYPATPTYPSPINEQAVCRNGQRVHGPIVRQIEQSHNSILAYRRKVFFSRSARLGNSVRPAGAAATNFWRFMGHTGYNVQQIAFEVGMVPADTAATDPHVLVKITPSGGSEYTVGEIHFAEINTVLPPEFPDHMNWQRLLYTVDAATPLLENQEYEVRLQLVDYASVFAMTAYEVGKAEIDTSDTASVHARVGSGSPIIDEDYEHLLIGQTGAWQKNGAHVFSWAPEDGIGPSFSHGATARNLWDYSNVGVSSSNPNMKSQLQYHNSASATTVPVKFAVYAERTAGAGTVTNNKVNLEGLSGGDITVDSINAAGWYTATGTWETSAQNYIVSVETDPVDTIRIDAVCCWEIE